MTARRALWVLIVASGALRLVWAAAVGLGHDEAYHYLFTVHRDWSYFDHPPMLALVESVGPGLFGSAAPGALRLGFVVLFAGSTLILARLTARAFGEWAGFWAALAMNVSAYHTAAAGAFALPDGPLLFFWLLTLDRLSVAVETPERIGRWALVGLAWGGALLSKYHAVFLPMGGLVYLVVTPSARRILRTPGPYLAALVGVAMFAPVLAWNAAHHWASFAFQGGRAVGAMGFRPLAMLAALAGQAAYLLPWIWVPLVIALVVAVHRLVRGEASDAERFFLSQSITPLALFTAVSAVRPILPHWALVGYLSAYPLLGRLWAARAATRPARMRKAAVILVAIPVALTLTIALQYRFGIIPIERFTSKKLTLAQVDPTADLFGWDQLGEEMKRRGLLEPGTFVFTSMWYHSGHVGYATRKSGVPVVCYSPGDARSFAFWSNPGEWVGRDGLLVALGPKEIEPACYRKWFATIEPAGEVPIVRRGQVVRTVRLFRCRDQLLPFPFDYEHAPRRRGAAGQVAARPQGIGAALPAAVR
jgi:4-amino-4-deoxy-L-arabinose transferase-like glycosyltransferase